MSSNLISRRKAINAVYGMARPTGIDELPYEYAEDVINNLPSADIMECARAIKKYCENCSDCEKCKFSREAIHLTGTVWHKCRLREGGCPNMWDLPEGEKGGE